jgi:hypothetical protein
VPPVAAISTGTSDSVSSGSTSKNDLNSPLSEALNAGVTAITPSASVTVSKAHSSSDEANLASIAFVIARPRLGPCPQTGALSK